MKDNKGIIKGNDEHAKEIDELKSLWKSLDERLSSDKKLNYHIHSIESNYTIRRLSDFKRILSKEYSKMEAWIIVLETISKKLAEFMDKVDPQSHQSLMIKKILEKKDLMPLETIELFLQLIVDEGTTSEAGKINLIPFRDTKNKKPKPSPEKDKLIQLIADNKEDILKETTDKARYIEIEKAYTKKYYTSKVPSNSHIRTALKEFLSRK